MNTTRVLASLAVAAVLAVGSTPAAHAGHNSNDWFNPRGWICAAVPVWC